MPRRKQSLGGCRLFIHNTLQRWMGLPSAPPRARCLWSADTQTHLNNMHTNNVNTEVRTVTPQFAPAGNLGEHAITVVPFTISNIRELVKDDKNAEGLADMMNAQAHIKFSSPAFVARVLQALETEDPASPYAQAEGEKRDAWMKRIFADAKVAASDVAKTTFDFPAIFAEWAAKERTTKDKREVLKNFSAVENVIRTKWDTSSEKGQTALGEALKLKDVVGTPSAEVLVKFMAKYKAPETTVDADNLLGA